MYITLSRQPIGHATIAMASNLIAMGASNLRAMAFNLLWHGLQPTMASNLLKMAFTNMQHLYNLLVHPPLPSPADRTKPSAIPGRVLTRRHWRQTAK